jgi:hypothetical protein
VLAEQQLSALLFVVKLARLAVDRHPVAQGMAQRSASSDGPDNRRLVCRILARVAAAEGRGIPMVVRHPGTKASPASGPEEDAAANRALLLEIQSMLDRADAEDALRQRNRTLTWVEDELAAAVQELRARTEVTQHDVYIALSQRLEALGIQPTELNVDIGDDAEAAWLHSDQGPLAVVVGALAPEVKLSAKTLWNARAHEGLPLATVGGRYVSHRVVRQMAQEVATSIGPAALDPVALSKLQRLDATTSERVSEVVWQQLRELVTKPAVYSVCLRSTDTPESWDDIRERLGSAIQDAKLVNILATAVLTSLWSSTAANVSDPVCQLLGPEMCNQLVETVHARKEEWAAIFLLSQMRAGQLTADESGFPASEIEALIDHLVTTRVTTEFAQRIDIALSRAEAAGEV